MALEATFGKFPDYSATDINVFTVYLNFISRLHLGIRE
jgi:hypothetical protein